MLPRQRSLLREQSDLRTVYTAVGSDGVELEQGHVGFEAAQSAFGMRKEDPYDCSQFSFSKRIMVVVLFVILLLNRGCISIIEGFVQYEGKVAVLSPMFLNGMRSGIAAILFLIFAGIMRCCVVLRNKHFWSWVAHASGDRLATLHRTGSSIPIEEAAQSAPRPWYDPLLCCTLPVMSGASAFVHPQHLPRDPLGQPVKNGALNWRFVDQ